MADATPDLRLPSQPHSTDTAIEPVLISYPAGDMRLSWPKWLVTYEDGIPSMRSTIPVLIELRITSHHMVKTDAGLNGLYISRRRVGNNVYGIFVDVVK